MFKSVLLLYKKSAYKIYFLERKGIVKGPNKRFIADQLKKFKRAHQEHYQTLKTVTEVLIEHEVKFSEHFRGQKINYHQYDLIITVGGDGTFLEAARNAQNQVLIGVNSAPSYSTGSLCVANAKNFKTVIKKVIAKKYRVRHYHRLRICVDHLRRPVDALNDILICHENPAMMSRYCLRVGAREEEQRSSGLWVAAPPGSSGALHSAGGNLIKKTHKKFQYIPRELYPRSRQTYKLRGGILQAKQTITAISLMRKGAVYVDGAHIKIPFEYGASCEVSISPKPVKTIQIT